MRIFQPVVGLAVLGVTLALTVRSFRPELALLIGVATGIAVLLSVVGELTGVIDALRAAARQYGVDEGYLGVLLKIIGIAYLAQFGVQICRDAERIGPRRPRWSWPGACSCSRRRLPAAVAMLASAAELLRRAAP